MIPSVLLVSLVVAAQPVDDPVEEVAAFYLERCSGRSRAEVRACEEALADNRKRIEGERYVATIPSARLAGKRPVKVFAARADGIAAIELDPVITADRLSDAPDACLALGDRPVRLEAKVGTGPGSEQWRARVEALVAKARLRLELAFQVRGEKRLGARRCARVGAALRAVDPDTGQVLAGPAKADGLQERPLHPALLGTGLADPVQAWAQQVRVTIGRSLAVPGREPAGEAHVLLRVGRGGEVREAKLQQSSGNSTFDQTVLRAVQGVQALPPPPAPAQSSIERSGVVLRFRR